MKKFAAFDIDGTLIRWQLYHAVVDKLAQKGLLGDTAYEELHKARMVWKRREHPGAFHDYEMKLVRTYEQALPTLTGKEFDEAVEKVALEYKTQVYTYTRDLAKRLKDDGYVLIAISGSHEELVEHVAKQFDFDYWIGTQYKRENGKFTGKVELGNRNKNETLLALAKHYKLTMDGSYAVGDSRSDAAMLEIVENPIAFNPDQELLQIATKKQWPIVIERKNVIYKLEPDSGQYILA